MLVEKAEASVASLLREYMHLQGSGCHQEAELRGKLRGFKEAFKTARLIKDERFQELFAEAHLEVFGMTSAAKTLAIGVAAQQLTMNDWERFDAPTVMRRAGQK